MNINANSLMQFHLVDKSIVQKLNNKRKLNKSNLDIDLMKFKNFSIE